MPFVYQSLSTSRYIYIVIEKTGVFPQYVSSVLFCCVLKHGGLETFLRPQISRPVHKGSIGHDRAYAEGGLDTREVHFPHDWLRTRVHKKRRKG